MENCRISSSGSPEVLVPNARLPRDGLPGAELLVQGVHSDRPCSFTGAGNRAGSLESGQEDTQAPGKWFPWLQEVHSKNSFLAFPTFFTSDSMGGNQVPDLSKNKLKNSR